MSRWSEYPGPVKLRLRAASGEGGAIQMVVPNNTLEQLPLG
jgi:hypothetical protein